MCLHGSTSSSPPARGSGHSRAPLSLLEELDDWLADRIGLRRRLRIRGRERVRAWNTRLGKGWQVRSHAELLPGTNRLETMFRRLPLEEDACQTNDAKEAAMPPRGVKKGTKRARQYEHIKDSLEQRGSSEAKAEEIAARTVNKER